jgi:transferrin binding protein
MVATLGACSTGGGGGGGSTVPGGTENPPPPGETTPRTDAAFTSFSAVQPNQNVIMSGSATTISGTQMSDGTVTSVNPEANDSATLGSGRLTLGFDSQRSLTALAIAAPEGNVSFDRSAGHNISCGGGTCSASRASASAVTGDAFSNGWNYQTYGAWAVHSNPSSFVFGAVSAGNATPGNAVPTTGLATFNGRASGYFIDMAGVTFTTSASMTANVDFQQRFIGFGTANTTLVNTNTGAQSTDTGLNMRGTFDWSAGVNGFSGPVETNNDNLSGFASGKFYGPKAEEIGGTYRLISGPTSRMVGGFGGKR